MKFIYFLEGSDPFVMALDIIRLKDVYLHEEVVPRNVYALERSLRNEKYLRNPVLIDKKSFVVLDGTHRVYVLRKLGYEYVVAGLVDYSDPRIKLKRWFRVFEGPKMKILNLLEEHGFERDSQENVSFNASDSLIMLVDSDVYIHRFRTGGVDIYQKLCILERDMVDRGVKIRYVTEQEALDEWKRGRPVLVTPLLTKEAIIESARAGKLYPPKSTRHIFPVRPLFVDFPLRYLREDFEREYVRRVLKEYSLGRIYLKINGKITIDRFYEEEKLVLFL